MRRGRPRKQIDPQPQAANPEETEEATHAESIRSPSQVILDDFFPLLSGSKARVPTPIPSTFTPVPGIAVDVDYVVNSEATLIDPPPNPKKIENEGNPTPSKLNWNLLHFASRGMPLEQFPDMGMDDEIVIEMEDIESELDYWKNTLVGQLIGARPKLEQVREYVAKYWKQVETPEVLYFRKGWFYFRFRNQSDLDTILKGGAWRWGLNTWVLKKWIPFFGKEMESITQVPVWVLFPDLDPCLWSAKALSKLASKLGSALYADHFTACKAKLSFARVLIELDVSKDLPTSMTIRTPYGTITQNVEYEWVPFYCHSCKKMGHTQGLCRLNKPKATKVTKQYKEKVLSETETIPEAIVQAEETVNVETVTPEVVRGEVAVGGNAGFIPPVLELPFTPARGIVDREGFVSVPCKTSSKLIDATREGIPILNMFASLGEQCGEVRGLENEGVQCGDGHDGDPFST